MLHRLAFAKNSAKGAVVVRALRLVFRSHETTAYLPCVRIGVVHVKVFRRHASRSMLRRIRSTIHKAMMEGKDVLDLYEALAKPMHRVDCNDAQRSPDADDDPLTMLTRSVETTDESGLLTLFGQIAP